MIDLMKKSCDQVKNSASFFVCNLINIQYKASKRQELIDMIINDFAKSSSFVLRKTFIAFCISAVKVFSFKTFRTFFLECYLNMFHDKVSEVRMKFLQSAPSIRPYFE
jgi:hypothetical protein